MIGGIPAQLAVAALVVYWPLVRSIQRSARAGGWCAMLAGCCPRAAPRGPGAHPDAPAPAAGHGRGRDTAAAGGPYRLSLAGHRRRCPVAGHLAAGRLPRAGRPGAGRGARSPSGCGWPASCTRWSTPTRGGCRPGACCTAASTGDPRHPPPAARPPGRRLPDRGRDGAAVRRALAHRRRRGARRQGGPGAARPEPHRGTGAPGRAAGPDAGRGGGRGRRRAPPPRARPARRHPAAAGLPGHQPGYGPSPGSDRRARRARPSPTRTRRPRPPSPSCGT